MLEDRKKEANEQRIKKKESFTTTQINHIKCRATVLKRRLVTKLTFIPLLHRGSFWHINNRQLLKTLWEKEKLLVTSNFSFSHNVFNLIRWLYPHLPIFLTSYLYLLLNWKSLLIDWMVFYAAFNSISVISRRQFTLFMLSWVSPVLGQALKCLAKGHSHEKTQRIQWGSNPGPLDYESNTLPLSHVGPGRA